MGKQSLQKVQTQKQQNKMLGVRSMTEQTFEDVFDSMIKGLDETIKTIKQINEDLKYILDTFKSEKTEER
jgi:hypothetical protein